MQTSVQPSRSFSTNRLLIGDMACADDTVNKGLNTILPNSFRQPKILIQPMEYLEGGLSQVEHRVLEELANGSSLRKFVVWVGEELSDSSVKEKLNVC